MPSFERGVYEPPSDDIHVFDEDGPEAEDEGSRLPLVLVISLLVLAAFFGVVWLAYSQGVQRGRSDAPRVIVAASGPTKEVPANAGGAPNNYNGLKIYQQPAPADEDVDQDSVPPPPTETAKPVAPMTAAAAPITGAPKNKKLLAQSAALSVSPTPQLKPSVLPSKTGTPSETPKKSPAKSVAIAAAAVPPATQTITPAVPSEPQQNAEAATPSPTPVVHVASSGTATLQIGAYKSQAEADAAWKSYQSKHPFVGGYSEDVQKANLGAKGVWYRLRIGSLSDKAAATALCDKLKADGGTCFLAK